MIISNKENQLTIDSSYRSGRVMEVAQSVQLAEQVLHEFADLGVLRVI